MGVLNFNRGYQAGPQFAGGGEPPDNSEVKERIAKLEAVLPYLATKGDVSEAKTSIITFTAMFGAALAAIAITVIVFAINRANPPQSAAPQPQPIVIQLPAQPSTPAPTVVPTTK